MAEPRTLDDAMADFLDEYGSQYLSLEGPDIRGNWHAEIVASGIQDAIAMRGSPTAALDAALAIARSQETPDTGERSK